MTSMVWSTAVRRRCTPVLALGGAGVTWALEQAGLRAVAAGDVQDRDPVAAVLQGLGRQLTVADFEVAATRHGC
ncbi:MAG: hypothetical protein ABI336_12345 [Humibacillus sp.]